MHRRITVIPSLLDPKYDRTREKRLRVGCVTSLLRHQAPRMLYNATYPQSYISCLSSVRVALKLQVAQNHNPLLHVATPSSSSSPSHLLLLHNEANHDLARAHFRFRLIDLRTVLIPPTVEPNEYTNRELRHNSFNWNKEYHSYIFIRSSHSSNSFHLVPYLLETPGRGCSVVRWRRPIHQERLGEKEDRAEPQIKNERKGKEKGRHRRWMCCRRMGHRNMPLRKQDRNCLMGDCFFCDIIWVKTNSTDSSLRFSYSTSPKSEIFLKNRKEV